MRELTDLFLSLVRIDSPSGKEGPLARHLRGELERLGFEVREVGRGGESGCGNLLGGVPGQSPLSGLMLCAHMDTVVSNAGVEPQLDDRTIRSDGQRILGADDRAGLAAILWVAGRLLRSGVSLAGLKVAFTAQEESGQGGARDLDLSALGVTEVLVLDAGGPAGTVVVSSPYLEEFKAVFKGRAAHAGVEPEKGINALKMAASAICELPLGRLSGDTTANIGVIKGGVRVNTVPAEVVLEGEIRAPEREEVDRVVHSFRSVFEKAALGGSVAFSRVEAVPGYRIDDRDPFLREVEEAFREVGLSPSRVFRGGASDANFFNAAGARALNIGMGFEENHTPAERLELDQFHSAVAVVETLIRRRLKGS